MILTKPFFCLYTRYGIVLVSYDRAITVNISVTHIKPNETEMAEEQRRSSSNGKWTEVDKGNRMIMP